MKTVEFKFDLDQKVNTEFGEGRVTMLGVDDNGVVYFVQRAAGGSWVKEKFLSAAAE